MVSSLHSGAAQAALRRQKSTQFTIAGGVSPAPAPVSGCVGPESPQLDAVVTAAAAIANHAARNQGDVVMASRCTFARDRLTHGFRMLVLALKRCTAPEAACRAGAGSCSRSWVSGAARTGR